MLTRIDLYPERRYTFSSVVRAGDFLFTTHIPGHWDDRGELVEGIENQTRQCLVRMGDYLRAGDASLEDVAKVTVYLRDLRDFEAMDRIYATCFASGYPARMTATTAMLDSACLVLMEAVAYAPQGAQS